MGTRLELHSELLKYYPNVYFQPPSNYKMNYPCIVYNRSDLYNQYGNNASYILKQEYSVMLIEKDPDSKVAMDMVKNFEYCKIQQYYEVDNLHHTTLNITY